MLNKIRKELGLESFSLADFLDGYDNINGWKYDTTPTDLVEWSEKLRRIKGEKFSFKDREYLFQIYRDTNKEIKIVKSRQMEITEFAINWLVFNLTKNPFTVGLYLSDRQDHVSIFSKLRLKSQCLNQSPTLKEMAKLGNVSLQPFKNDSNLYMFSAWGNFEAARSIPVDFAVVDEMQSVKVEALPVLKETLSKSRHGKILEIGTGSDEGGEWYKEWSHGTVYEWDLQNKRWTRKSDIVPNISSYHLSQDMASWISAEKLEDKRQNYPPRQYVNEVEGWWFKGARKPLLPKEIQALFDKAMSFTPSKDVDHTMPVYLGVDWGGGVNAFTVVWIWQLVNDALPRFKLLNVRKFDQPEDRSTEVQADKVIELMDKFEVDQAVMDAGGGTRQVEKLSNRYGPRMVKCTFITRPEDPFELISSENRVNVDRTWGIETIIDLITRPETRADYPNPIPRIFIPASDLEKVEWVIDHFTCIEAESIQLSSGRNYVRYTHPEETNDDALMACLYAYMAHLVKKGSEWRWIRG